MKHKMMQVAPKIPVKLGKIFENLRNFSENEALQYWKIYFDFGYYFLLVPFRYRFNLDSGSYEIHTNFIQTVLRVLAAILVAFYFLMNVRQKYVETTRNPSQYFDIASYFFDTFFLLPVYLSFGRQSRFINRVFQEFQHSPYARSPRINTKYRMGPKLVTIFFCFLCIVHPFTYMMQVSVTAGWTSEGFLKTFSRDGRRVFKALLPKTMSSCDPRIVTFFTVLSLFSNLVDKLINTYADVLFLVTVLMFRQLVQYFTQTLSGPSYVSTAQILDHYKWLKSVTESINDGMGVVTISFILGNLPFFATSVLTIFIEGNTFERAINIVVTLYYFSALFIAAKACRDVEEIRQWIWREENYTRIHPLKLSVLLHETTAQPVAISAYGCINVNYGSVGSIVSIIFTYALLKQQFQSQP